MEKEKEKDKDKDNDKDKEKEKEKKEKTNKKKNKNKNKNLRQTAKPHNRMPRWTAPMEVRHGLCVTRGSHSFICHTDSDNTVVCTP